MHLQQVSLVYISLVCFLVQAESPARPCIRRYYGHDSFVCVCNATYCDEADPKPTLSAKEFVAYTSTQQGLRLERSVHVFSAEDIDEAEVTIDSTVMFQSIHGYGGAMTDATGINIASLSKEAQAELIQAIVFANYSLIRVPMGGTDFSTRPYTYHDNQMKDYQLKNFSLAEEDYKYKIPYLQTLMKKLPQLKLMTAPWSAPAYMKTNNAISGGGSLKKGYQKTWAQYMVDFLDAYKEHGVTFQKLEIQNEAFIANSPTYYFNGMGWLPQTQGHFMSEYLKPALVAAGYGDIELITGSDQLLFMRYWLEDFVQNENATTVLDGSGIHWYLDQFTPSSFRETMHDLAPNKYMIYTEACIGSGMPEDKHVMLGSWNRGEQYLSSLIAVCNSWVVGWCDWNMALNVQGGPNWGKNYVDSQIIVNATADEFLKQPMYYAIYHMSAFVPPKSKRIQIDVQDTSLEIAGFKTPSDSIVLVMLNSKNSDRNFTACDITLNVCLNMCLAARSMQTIVYNN